MVNKFFCHDQKLVDKIQKLGPYSKLSLTKFKTWRLITTIMVFILSLFLKFHCFFALFVSVLYYNLFRVILLDVKLLQRSDKLEKESLYFLAVLKLAIAKNHHFFKALDLTATSVRSEFAKEIRIALLELKLGKSFKEAFQSMSRHIPSKIIVELIDVFILMHETNDQNTLYLDEKMNQLENHYDKRKAKQIKLLPNIISMVMIIFILPILLLIIFGPNIIN